MPACFNPLISVWYIKKLNFPRPAHGTSSTCPVIRTRLPAFITLSASHTHFYKTLLPAGLAGGLFLLPAVSRGKKLRAHTENACKNTGHTYNEGGYCAETGEVVCLPRSHNPEDANRFYREEIRPTCARKYPETMVRVVSENCLMTAERLKALGEDICVFNMAKDTTSEGEGGAQEDQLFLRSDYYLFLCCSCGGAQERSPSAAPDLYLLDLGFSGVFTRNVTVFRGGMWLSSLRGYWQSPNSPECSRESFSA
ncbi:MAG: poly(ADP-ribose) glycohydrolase domain-containing protein [Akkermansia sp.]